MDFKDIRKLRDLEHLLPDSAFPDTDEAWKQFNQRHVAKRKGKFAGILLYVSAVTCIMLFRCLLAPDAIKQSSLSENHASQGAILPEPKRKAMEEAPAKPMENVIDQKPERTYSLSPTTSFLQKTNEEEKRFPHILGKTFYLSAKSVVRSSSDNPRAKDHSPGVISISQTLSLSRRLFDSRPIQGLYGGFIPLKINDRFMPMSFSSRPLANKIGSESADSSNLKAKDSIDHVATTSQGKGSTPGASNTRHKVFISLALQNSQRTNLGQMQWINPEVQGVFSFPFGKWSLSVGLGIGTSSLFNEHEVMVSDKYNPTQVPGIDFRDSIRTSTVRKNYFNIPFGLSRQIGKAYRVQAGIDWRMNYRAIFEKERFVIASLSRFNPSGDQDTIVGRDKELLNIRQLQREVFYTVSISRSFGRLEVYASMRNRFLRFSEPTAFPRNDGHFIQRQDKSQMQWLLGISYRINQ